jgi:hypothetical protein
VGSVIVGTVSDDTAIFAMSYSTEPVLPLDNGQVAALSEYREAAGKL